MSFFNKVVRARTGECKRCVIINIESLAIVCYASFFFFSSMSHFTDVVLARKRKQRVEKKLAEENLRDRLMPRWYFSVSGQGLLR